TSTTATPTSGCSSPSPEQEAIMTGRDGRTNRLRICFERILPDDVDEERAVRRALREEIIASSDAPLDPDTVQSATRMALVKSKKWRTGLTLRCRFLDGSTRMKERVETIA